MVEATALDLSDFGSFRKSESIDPSLILSKIAIIQVYFTITLVLIRWITWDIILSKDAPFKFFSIFRPSDLNDGSMLTVLYIYLTSITTSLIIGFLLRPIVYRSKLCLDFGCTLYGIHALFCLIFDDFGAVFSIKNGLIQLVSCIITVQVGRMWCERLELLPIPLTGAAVPANAASSSLHMNQTSQLGVSQAIPFGMTRLRFALPIFTGIIAKIINFLTPSSKQHDLTLAPVPNAIPLQKMPSMPLSLPSFDKAQA